MADCCKPGKGESSCCGGEKTRLIYSCSGAANTGFLADAVSRRLMADGTGKMTCLAAVGAGLSGFIASAEGADENVVIDGCPVACGGELFDNRKLPYRHFVLTDYGVKKGKTEITPEVIAEIEEKLREEIRNG